MLHLHSYIQSSLQSTYELCNWQEVTWSQKAHYSSVIFFLTPALCSVSSILEVVQTTSRPFKNTAPISSFSADSWINIIVRRITIHILSKLNIIKKNVLFLQNKLLIFSLKYVLISTILIYKHKFLLIPFADIPQDWIQAFFWLRLRPLRPEKKQKMSNKSLKKLNRAARLI